MGWDTLATSAGTTQETTDWCTFAIIFNSGGGLKRNDAIPAFERGSYNLTEQNRITTS